LAGSYHTQDTIAAIASPAGGAARGIVRLSGPQVLAVLARCFEPSDQLPTATRATAFAGSLLLASDSRRLPVSLYLWPTERSYTRQPLAELHTIGSPPLLAGALASLCAAGARLAEPGEFTLRAFLAGRLDLTQAEAVLGVIDADSQIALAGALAQLAGGLARPLAGLHESLLDLLAHLEAGLDFVEEDIEFVSRDEVGRQLAAADQAVHALLARMDARTDAIDRPRVVLTGSPNVGKSSLFNALCRGQALVSDQPGTTRDYLTAEFDLDGVRVQLVDTAGLGSESPAHPIQHAAQAAGQAQSKQADLTLLCLDATRPMNPRELQELRAPRANRLIVLTKCDSPRRLPIPADSISTSSVTGSGLEHLRRGVRSALDSSSNASNSTVAGTAARCRQSLLSAAEALRTAAEVNSAARGEELVAAELRRALDEIGKVVGVVYTDDILDRIFSRFCIGK